MPIDSETKVLILKVQNELSGELRRLNRDFQRTNTESQKLIKQSVTGFKNMALAIGGVVAAMRVAARTVRAGIDQMQLVAQAEQVKQAWTSMAQSVGQSAQGIIDELAAAAGGTVSQFRLMQTASQAALLGIPMEHLVGMMRTARASATALGGDVTQMFDDIVRGVARGSVMILDNLGIKATGAVKRYAEQLGKTEAQLTGVERQQALLNTVLAESERILGMVGEVGQTVTDAERWQRVTTAAENFRIELSDNLLPVFRTLTDISLGFLDTLSTAFDYQTTLRAAGTRSIEDIASMNRAEIEGTIRVLQIEMANLSTPMGRILRGVGISGAEELTAQLDILIQRYQGQLMNMPIATGAPNAGVAAAQQANIARALGAPNVISPDEMAQKIAKANAEAAETARQEMLSIWQENVEAQYRGQEFEREYHEANFQAALKDIREQQAVDAQAEFDRQKAADQRESMLEALKAVEDEIKWRQVEAFQNLDMALTDTEGALSQGLQDLVTETLTPETPFSGDFVDFMDNLWTGVGKLIDLNPDLLLMWGTIDAIMAMFAGFASIVGPSVEGILSDIFGVFEAIGQFAGTILLPILRPIEIFVSGVTSATADALGELFKAVAPAFGAIGDILTGILNPALAVLEPALKLIGSLFASLTPLFELIAGAIQLAFSPISLLLIGTMSVINLVIEQINKLLVLGGRSAVELFDIEPMVGMLPEFMRKWFTETTGSAAMAPTVGSAAEGKLTAKEYFGESMVSEGGLTKEQREEYSRYLSSYQYGGLVPYDQLAVLHGGEQILPVSEARTYRAGGSGATVVVNAPNAQYIDASLAADLVSMGLAELRT